MKRCAICKRGVDGSSLTAFSVPKDVIKREKWSKICGAKLLRTSRICKDHFPASSIATMGKLMKLLPNAEPIINNE